MRNFRLLNIWQTGFQISIKCYEITRSFPGEEKFGLSTQIQKAAVSIPSNIAEGCSRESVKDFIRFLSIAIGSAFELETQLLIASALLYGNQELITDTLSLLTTEEKMLNNFIKTLKQDKGYK